MISKFIHLRKLSDIAEIRSGYTFREKIVEVELSQANAHIAQIKDVREIAEVNQSLLLDPSQLPFIEWQGKKSALIPSGTVILPSRGSRGGYFRASCISENANSTFPLIVTSQFLVITPKKGVLPEFLCWSLNQPKIQFWLSQGAGSQGSSMAVMLKTNIGSEISLSIPSIETQEKIIRIHQLWEKEQELNIRLQANRQKMLQGMFNQLLNE